MFEVEAFRFVAEGVDIAEVRAVVELCDVPCDIKLALSIRHRNAAHRGRGHLPIRRVIHRPMVVIHTLILDVMNLRVLLPYKLVVPEQPRIVVLERHPVHHVQLRDIVGVVRELECPVQRLHHRDGARGGETEIPARGIRVEDEVGEGVGVVEGRPVAADVGFERGGADGVVSEKERAGQGVEEAVGDGEGVEVDGVGAGVEELAYDEENLRWEVH